MFVSLSVCLFVSLFVCLFVFVSLFVCLFICLFVCLFVGNKKERKKNMFMTTQILHFLSFFLQVLN